MKQATAVNQAVKRYAKLRKRGYGQLSAHGEILKLYPWIPRSALARMK